MSIREKFVSSFLLNMLLATTVLANPEFVQNGAAGFVVSNIQYALGEDADKTGACPDGMTEGYPDIGAAFHDLPELRLQQGEKEDKHVRRVYGAAFSNAAAKNYEPGIGSSKTYIPNGEWPKPGG